MDFFDVVNVYGLVFALLQAIPLFLYSRKHPTSPDAFPNIAMVYLDRIGRFGSLFLMSFHLGFAERGFTEPKDLMKRFWIITMAILVAACLLMWAVFVKRGGRGLAKAIAAVSASSVMLSGILQVNILLLTAGFIYLIGELYIIRCVIPK